MPEKPGSRKKLFALHSWLGFHLAFVMSLVLLTGTLATVSNEIDWLVNSDMRVTPGDEKVSWGEMEATIKRHVPDHKLVSLTAMPVSSLSADYFAYRARMQDRAGTPYFLHVNQWTGAITGVTQVLTVQRFLRDLHRYLFMPAIIGLPLVTSLAFVLACSLYTGLKTARNWRTLSTRVRLNSGVRIAVGDFHKASGLWTSWFFIIMIVTGVWYLIEFGTLRAADVRLDPPLYKVSDMQAAGTAAGLHLPTNMLVAKAVNAYPGFEPTSIDYPQKAADPLVVSGRAGTLLVRERANAIFFNAATGEIIGINREDALNTGRLINQIADPLHFGYWGGLTTKIIWFTFGLAMTGLSITGLWLTIKRAEPKGLSRAQLLTLPVLVGTCVAGYFWYEDYAPRAIQGLPDLVQSHTE